MKSAPQEKAMSSVESASKKAVNLSLNEILVQESRAYCGNLSAKVEELLQVYVQSERQARQAHQQQAQEAVAHWNALHDAAGSYADGHSTL
jgi:post-segregation antitoxin (ccd killing protein)